MAEEKLIPSATTLTDLGSGNFRIRTFYSPIVDVPPTAWFLDETTIFQSDEEGGIILYESE